MPGPVPGASRHGARPYATTKRIGGAHIENDFNALHVKLPDAKPRGPYRVRSLRSVALNLGRGFALSISAISRDFRP